MKSSEQISVTDLSQAENALHTFKRRRTRTFILAIITTLLVGLLVAQGSLDILPLINPTTSTATFLLYSLSMLNVFATLLLFVVLARNFWKLGQEHREQKFGSKFRTKLVLGSLAISILPVFMLFFFAYSIVNRSLDKWFNLPAERFQADVDFIRDKLLTIELDNLAGVARSVTRSIKTLYPTISNENTLQKSSNVHEILNDLFRAELKNHELATLTLADNNGQTVLSFGKDDFALSKIQELALGKLGAQSYNESIIGPNGQIYLLTKTPIKLSSNQSVSEHKNINSPNQKTYRQVGSIFLSKLLPQQLSEKFQKLSNEAQYRTDLTIQSKKLKLTYLCILSFVTLLLIFGSTWIALQVARSVTIPIMALAEGTQKVAQGELNYRVSIPAEDELALLVSSFNEMASQLYANSIELQNNAIELQATNREIEERNRYIETILQSLFTGIVSLDTEQRLRTINRAGIELLGIEAPPIGEFLEKFIPQINLNEFRRVLRRTKRLGQATSDIELRLPNQKLIHLAVSGTAIRDSKGTYQGTVLMIEDLSPLIQAQQSAVWSEVAKRMAHEIKNPLTPIQLSAQRIRKNVERYGVDSTRTYQTVKECTAIIEREVDTLQRMVSEFSKFAKLPDIRLEPASINDIAVNTIKLYEDRLSNIQLKLELDEKIPSLNLDQEQFKRVFVNLIDNAVLAFEGLNDNKAISHSNVIILATEYLIEQDIVRVIVSDTGQGVSPEDKDKLFQPYFSKRNRGTGLGLAIVSHIVTNHQGRIWVEDNKPHGAQFIIELPVLIKEDLYNTLELSS